MVPSRVLPDQPSERNRTLQVRQSPWQYAMWVRSGNRHGGMCCGCSAHVGLGRQRSHGCQLCCRRCRTNDQHMGHRVAMRSGFANVHRLLLDTGPPAHCAPMLGPWSQASWREPVPPPWMRSRTPAAKHDTLSFSSRTLHGFSFQYFVYIHDYCSSPFYYKCSS
jgi:hypothetical protein